MEEHRPTQEEKEEFLAQLEQEGMPKTCDICEKFTPLEILPLFNDTVAFGNLFLTGFTECTNANPEEICPWLKRYRQWQRGE